MAAIPITVLLTRQSQTQGRASQSGTIAFSPSERQVKVNEIFPLDVWINPGSGSSPDTIAVLELKISYEENSLQMADPNSCLTLTSQLNSVSYLPRCDNGLVDIKLTAANVDMLITKSTKIATVNFLAKTPGTTRVTFNKKTTAGSVGNINGNIIGTTQPATITIVP